MQFKSFAKQVNTRYNKLAQQELYTTDVDLWEVYLKAFPEGTDPIYKTNTEHDCNCCKQFIRNIGKLVAIENGKTVTIWDVDAEYPYNIVAKALDEAVKAAKITGIFRTKEDEYGSESSLQKLEGTNVKVWNHFFGAVHHKHRTNTPDKARGDYATTVQVFERGLKELAPAAVQQVRELIASNALYRGEEHSRAVNAFDTLQKAYNGLPEAERPAFLWALATSPAARFRNTVIGTLVDDLSQGKDLEAAVRSFEAKVAPANYKRTTALITPAMIKAATAKIEELGIEDALQRRLAKLSDVTINNVLWADNEAAAQMKGGLHNLLMESVKPSVNEDKLIEISIEDFMKSVLPTAKSMEVLVKNHHIGNLVALTAPMHTTPSNLFKWNNDFAWSYNGNMTDSIKERVKAAGGNVTNAKLRVSLAWYNYDDLDLHCETPDAQHIYFGNKKGILDVDMNAGMGRTRTPVENMSFTQLHDGLYEFKVNQFSKRETSDTGFEIEIENEGKITSLTYAKDLRNETSFTLQVKGGVVIDINPGALDFGASSQPVWGIETEKFTRVETLMYSPNYWDDNAVGNKHWFFILEGCKADSPMRGIYNEFLRSDLEQHRKVFEVLGERTKCEVVPEQLSGLGFSSTRGDTVLVQVKTASGLRNFKVKF